MPVVHQINKWRDHGPSPKVVRATIDGLNRSSVVGFICVFCGRGGRCCGAHFHIASMRPKGMRAKYWNQCTDLSIFLALCISHCFLLNSWGERCQTNFEFFFFFVME
ncbi:hypothetical protein AMTRI_Chr04g179960 [Amborella trichopoda]